MPFIVPKYGKDVMKHVSFAGTPNDRAFPQLPGAARTVAEHFRINESILFRSTFVVSDLRATFPFVCGQRLCLSKCELRTLPGSPSSNSCDPNLLEMGFALYKCGIPVLSNGRINICRSRSRFHLQISTSHFRFPLYASISAD